MKKGKTHIYPLTTTQCSMGPPRAKQFLNLSIGYTELALALKFMSLKTY